MRVKALLNKSDLSTTPKCAMKISSPQSRAKLPKQVLEKQPEPGACRNQGLIRRFPTRFCWSFCLDMVSTFCFVADFFQHWGYVHLFQFRDWMPDLNISWHDQRPLNGNHPTIPECAVCIGSADCSELESVWWQQWPKVFYHPGILVRIPFKSKSRNSRSASRKPGKWPWNRFYGE